MGSVALAAVLCSSCFFARVSVRNAGVLFRDPDPVPDRIVDPRRPEARLAVLWVGHATVLLQIDDKYVLTDPVFTNYVGTVSHRLVEPGLLAADVPALEAVLISHRHYDHLSPESIEALGARAHAIVVPERTAEDIPAGPYRTFELGWWRSWESDGLRITAVPVQHVGGRAFDAGSHPFSFTGYVIEYHGLVVYYGGDTAYRSSMFTAVAEHFPRIDLALMPIGPIAPRDFMSATHVDPEEALRAVTELGARRMVPIHYDTFINSDDDVGDCLRGLASAMAKHGGGGPEVVALRIGEQRVLLAR